jgi:site-specific recombinase XerD
MNALIRQAERDSGTFARRNLAVLLVLRHTGIRVGELAKLKRGAWSVWLG